MPRFLMITWLAEIASCSYPTLPNFGGGPPSESSDVSSMMNFVVNTDITADLILDARRATLNRHDDSTAFDGGNNFNMNLMFLDAADLQVNTASSIRGKTNPKAGLTGISARDIRSIPRVLRTSASANLGAYVVPAQ